MWFGGAKIAVAGVLHISEHKLRGRSFNYARFSATADFRIDLLM